MSDGINVIDQFPEPDIDPDEVMIWIDLEMTGLNPVEDMILEVGLRLTDWNGEEEFARFTSIVHTPGWYERLCLGENRPALEIHQSNGLIIELRDLEQVEPPEPAPVSVWEVESLALDWLHQNKVPGGLALAGSSNHLDRYFLLRHMPQLAQHFTHRVIDVSAIREAMRVTTPTLYRHLTDQFADRASNHRVQSDIDDTIELWQWLIDNYLMI